MKNLSIIINALLVIAVGVLFFFQFSGNNENSNHQSTLNTSESYLKLAYVNVDSVFSKYTLATELNEELTQKSKSMQSRLERQMSDFEKDYKAFVDKAQKGIFLTQQRQEQAQQELMVKQREVQKLEMEYADELAQEQQKMNSRVFDSISNNIKSFNTPEKYQIIFGHATGGNILYGSEQIDITQDIINSLNSAYTKE